MSFLDAFRRRQRQPWDERLPSGVSAMDIGIPEWQRRQLGLDLSPDADQQPQGAIPPFVPSNKGVSPEWERLQQQLQSAGFPSQQQPTTQQPVSPEQQTRPRTVNPFIDRFNQTRPRIVDPAQSQMLTPEEQQVVGRQRINDRPQFDVDYLNELQNKPLGVKGKIGMALQGIASNLGYQPLPTGRQRDIAREQARLGQDVMLENQRLKRQDVQSQILARRQRAHMEGLPQARYIERSDGVYEVSPTYPQGRRVGNVPAEVKKAARGAVHYESREDGVYAIYEDDEGIKSVKVPGVPGKPAPVSGAQVAQAAEGEALAASTEKALEDEQKQLEGYKDQLTKNEQAINRKNAWWRSQAAKKVAEAQAEYRDLKMNEALDQVKAEDPDFQNGTFDTLTSNTESLRKAVQESDKRVKDMQGTIRSGQAKGARAPQTATPTGKPRVDHDKFQRDYEAAKTPAERAKIMKFYQDALKIAGQ